MKDYSKIPETCQLIDDIQEAIKGEDFIPYVAADLDYKLELIRKANSDLRLWGNEQHERFLDMEADNCSLSAECSENERKIKELEENLINMDSLIESLEEQILDLEDQNVRLKVIIAEL